ncbi:nucleotidyltransferase domain-containing protein [Endozoicomonas sp. ALB032]|uniref:nucleotidyltransferase domain-containing protein n=1 Tax=Endozoicomonas sp. ALB032 TaxID=3403082 RepID=UPI003BB7B58A
MFGLPEATLQQIIACLSGFTEISRAAIFGSRAMGTYRAGSDVDIVIWLTNDNPHTVARIAAALDELPTPYLFDVVDYGTITHEPLKAHIDNKAKPLILER